MGNCALKKLGHSFFAKPASQLVRDLIGKIVVRSLSGKQFRTRIVETEAYIGRMTWPVMLRKVARSERKSCSVQQEGPTFT